MKLILPLVIALLGLGAGVGAGLVLKPAPEVDILEETACAEEMEEDCEEADPFKPVAMENSGSSSASTGATTPRLSDPTVRIWSFMIWRNWILKQVQVSESRRCVIYRLFGTTARSFAIVSPIAKS